MDAPLPSSVRFSTGRGGLPRFEIQTPLAQAEVYLHGGHVAHFQPAGARPVLYTSSQSYFEGGRPIRGGVPVIFPWFGAHKENPDAPAHGLVRTRRWSAESVTELADGRVELLLAFQPDESLRQQWGGGWLLRHRILIGRELTLSLEITNTGTSEFRCEDALHTYFAISSIHDIEVRGLEATEYLTVIEDAPRKRQGDQPIRFRGETDRVYLNTQGAYDIVDPGWNRRIHIQATQARSAVVWNPWIEKSKRLADFDDNEWPNMVCVETGNIADNALQVSPGATHRSQTVISHHSL